MEKIKLVIVENEDFFAKSLGLILEDNEKIEVCSIFSNAEDALIKLPDLEADILLMDIDLGFGKMNGIEAIKAIFKNNISVNIMILTIFEDSNKVFEALEAGALGYILKSSNPEKIIDAILELNDGGSPMTPRIARKVASSFSSLELSKKEILTDREKEILGLIAKGQIEKEVANHLFISPKTVKKHIANIYEKLQVNNRVEALNKYFN